MKQYIYQPEQIGLKEWPSGTLRLPGIPFASSPQDADIFVCPGSLQLFLDPKSIQRLPFFKGNEARHIFFDVSDYEQMYNQPSVFIRCNLRPRHMKADPNSMAWPWPVEDFSDCIALPPEGFKYDVSFHGWLSSEARTTSLTSCRTHSQLDCDTAGYDDFTGYIYDTPEGIRRRAEFRRSMRESRIALCGESIPGVLPYRFFEALSAGRIPLLVSSHYILPFADEIPYDDFVIRLSTNDAIYAGDTIRQFLRRTPDEELVRRGRLGRHYYETRMHRDRWPELMAAEVQKRFSHLARCAS